MKKWYQNKKVWILAGGIVILAGIGGFVATHVKLRMDLLPYPSLEERMDRPLFFLQVNYPVTDHRTRTFPRCHWILPCVLSIIKMEF